MMIEPKIIVKESKNDKKPLIPKPSSSVVKNEKQHHLIGSRYNSCTKSMNSVNDKNRGSSFKNSMIENTRDCTIANSRNLIASFGGMYCEREKNSLNSIEVLRFPGDSNE